MGRKTRKRIALVSIRDDIKTEAHAVRRSKDQLNLWMNPEWVKQCGPCRRLRWIFQLVPRATLSESSDGDQSAHKPDFSQWSLDGSVSSEAVDSAMEMNQGISNWSLEPSGETSTPSTKASGPSEQVPVESEEPDDAPQLSHEDWIVQGEGAFAENQLDEAEKCFLTALLLNPISPIALSNLGVVFHTRGNLEAAEMCYPKVRRV